MDRGTTREQLMREFILDGALNALTEDGSTGLTMKAVAQKADVAKGTIYAYFDNKTDLLEALVEWSLNPLSQEFDQILSAQIDPRTTLSSLIERHLKFFDERRQIFRVLLYERHKILGNWSRYKTSQYRRFIDRVAGVISAGIKAGQFRPVDPAKAATMLVEANISLIHQRLFGEHLSEIEEDSELLVELFFHGLCRTHSPEQNSSD